MNPLTLTSESPLPFPSERESDSSSRTSYRAEPRGRAFALVRFYIFAAVVSSRREPAPPTHADEKMTIITVFQLNRMMTAFSV